MEESLNQFRRRYIKHLHEQLDGRIIILGDVGFPRAGKLISFALANRIPILLHPQPTVEGAFDDLKKRVELFEEESRFAVKVQEWPLTMHQPRRASRRGRNIKPDESRKARYSEPRNR